MTNRPIRRWNRRRFLQFGLGAAAAAAGSTLIPGTFGWLNRRGDAIVDAGTPPPPPKYVLGGTDGWISLPTSPAIPPYHPDSLAPAGLTTYMFGFADLTGLPTDQARRAMKNKVQACAPLMYFDENTDNVVRLHNLGLAQRPDLVDAHTIHWHGFRNVIPMFDGEPTSSVSVPIGRSLDYFYRPRAAGTYMYHCHVEDTEHVHMGMVGVLFVRPAQNAGVPSLGIPAGKYAYNDGVPPSNPRSTAYQREYALLLSEVWAEAHWDDAHIQLPDWSDYKADFVLLNGRVYPDTLLPSGTRNTTTGAFTTPAGRDDLRFQPYSSLIQANAGERVLLRLVNLGFTYQTMVVDGQRVRVVAKDESYLLGRDGTDQSYFTNTISIGPGESVDAIFIAPNVTTQTTFLLYNRTFTRATNGGGDWGGATTEIRVFPAGTLPPQVEPNT